MVAMTTQTITCTFKFELRSNEDQRAALSRNAGCRRFVFNRMLGLLNERREAKQRLLRYSAMCKLLTQWKREDETAFLRDAMSQPLQQALMDLDRSVQDYFRKPGDPAKKGWPRFQAKDIGDGFRLPQVKPDDVDEANARVKLPKIGWVRYRRSRLMRLTDRYGREVAGTVKRLLLNKDGGKWFIGFNVEFHLELPAPQEADIGIDFGVVHSVATSDGRFFDLDTKRIRGLEERVALYQRKLSLNLSSRKKLAHIGKAAPFEKHQPSRRRQELKHRIQKLQQRIRNIRMDFCKKLAHTLAHEYGCVYAEDLQVKNMTASAKGTADRPGERVKQKSGLNRAILRVGIYALRQTIGWAQKKTGGEICLVDPRNTSRTCPHCGQVSADNRRTQAKFRCVCCGFTANADTVGAINVMRKGRTKKAGEQLSPVLPSAHIQKKRIARVVNASRGGVCEASPEDVNSGNLSGVLCVST